MERIGERRGFRGLDATALKLIAVLFMTIDHVGAFCGSFAWVAEHMYPLRLVGRIAAPVFLFFVAEGLHHTRDKRLYLKRMYLASLCFGLLNAFVGALLECSFGNIFQSFAWLIGLVIVTESAAAGIRERKWKKIAGYPLLFLLFLGLSGGFGALAGPLSELPGFMGLFAPGALLAFICPPLEVEYSLGLIALGAVWYFMGDRRWRCALLLLLALMSWLQPWGYNRALTMFSGIQWGMIGAVPLLLLYNGERGAGMKWFFYIYYPTHTWLLALINRMNT